MIAACILTGLLSAASFNPYADLTRPTVDSNTAFFQGDQRSYIFAAPTGYRLVLDEAARDGFSLAFVPEDQAFDSADVLINATIFSFKGKKTPFRKIVAEDTTALRTHYGPSIEIWGVDSVYSGTRELIPTVYLNDKKRFLPTVMVSYFDGGSEVVIFELVISDRYPRFKAEPAYDEALQRFKALRRGDPSTVNFGSADSTDAAVKDF